MPFFNLLIYHLWDMVANPLQSKVTENHSSLTVLKDHKRNVLRRSQPIDSARGRSLASFRAGRVLLLLLAGERPTQTGAGQPGYGAIRRGWNGVSPCSIRSEQRTVSPSDLSRGRCSIRSEQRRVADVVFRDPRSSWRRRPSSAGMGPGQLKRGRGYPT